MLIRNLSTRALVLRDGEDNQYVIPAYGDVELSDSLWDDNEFRRWLRPRLRDVEVHSNQQFFDMKESVRAATTANITLSGLQTIDGVTLATGDRVLVKDQTTANQNGIYVASGGAWSRAPDADDANRLGPNLFVFVEEGTTNGDTAWVLTADAPITLGTTALPFAQFSGNTIIAGDGLGQTGNTFSVNVDGTTIDINADTLRVKPLGLTDAQIAAGNKDGLAATPSMRTLGTGAQQAAAGNDTRLSDSRTPTAHKTSHETGGSDVLDGNLDANARVGVRKNSAGSIFARRRLNLIEGANIVLTVADDAGSEEVDITIASTASGIAVRDAGVAVGTRPALNFIEGTNVTLTITDDSVGNEVEITIAVPSVDWTQVQNKPSTFTPSTHAASHATGGGDALTGNLDANARVAIRKNSAGSAFARRRVNLIEGTNVTIGVVDDSIDEEVDVTISATGGGGSGTSVKLENTLVGTRGAINLHEGASVDLTVTDDAASDEVDITVAIPNDGITDAKFRDSSAVSVIGRSANSIGDPADIAAAANNQVLRRVSDALGFGSLPLAAMEALAWTSYTPALTAATTNPTGWGMLGSWMQIGRLVVAYARANANAGFTAGSGNYFISLPANAGSFDNSRRPVGVGYVRDGSPANTIVIIAAAEDATKVRIYFQGGDRVTNAAPITWAQDDYMALFLCYEAAA